MEGNMDGFTIGLLSFFLTSIILLPLIGILYFKKRKQHKTLSERFKDVINLDLEKTKVQQEIDDLNSDYHNMRSEYKEKRQIYEKLMQDISVLEEDIEYLSFGLYKPHFDYDASEKYKKKIIEIRNSQKLIVKNKEAAVCQIQWEVGGSKREGKKMTNRNIKLVLRAFNSECDSAILKVKWNNVQRMEERIKKAFEALNKLGEPIHISITRNYLDLKLNELYLAHEYQEKLNEEKEEQRRIREEMREEEKVRKEVEKAKQEAEQDEKQYERALEQARDEIQEAEGEKLAKLQEELASLEQKLKEAQEKKERAISRAQLTKSGHVYVISNIGSFGKDIYKIGLTRRLEPLDRVRELGDASVPFRFDVHAMIYSENAPELEAKIHNKFDYKRINMVNSRKEFYGITLEEIENTVRDNNADIEFTKIAEAREYRESMAMRMKAEEKEKQIAEIKYPEEL